MHETHACVASHPIIEAPCPAHRYRRIRPPHLRPCGPPRFRHPPYSQPRRTSNIVTTMTVPHHSSQVLRSIVPIVSLATLSAPSLARVHCGPLAVFPSLG